MNRKERRGTAARERRQPRSTEQPGAPVAARLTALEQGLGTFTRVHAENARIINQGFGMQDAHIAVQYRVLNDIRKGNVMIDEHGDIALQYYHQLFAATKMVCDGLVALSKQAEPSITPDEVASNLVPLPDFGGDHAGA